MKNKTWRVSQSEKIYLIEMKNFIGGIICLLIGITILYFTLKKPIKGNLSYSNANGLLGGIIFIALGIGLLIGHFHL